MSGMRDGRASSDAPGERLLVWLFALVRVGAYAQAAAGLALVMPRLTDPAGAIAVLAGLGVASAVLIRRHFRHGAVDSLGLALADAAVIMAGLAAFTLVLRHSADPNTDNVVFPYAACATSHLGMTARRLYVPVAGAFLESALYLSLTAAIFGSDVLGRLSANAVPFFAWALGSWAVVRVYRRLTRELAEARALAERQAASLIRERERSQFTRELHAVRMAATVRELEEAELRGAMTRDLHDRVLQTLEFLCREGLIADARVRDHVAADAVWLRNLVRNELGRPESGLRSRIEEVAARHTAAGLRVELNTAGLDAVRLAARSEDALIGALVEALTNVRKHSGTRHAVVRATSSGGGLSVTVLDHGCGFDPIKPTAGVGLRESILQRISGIGGRVVITSELGAGTHLELAVPLESGEEPDEDQREKADGDHGEEPDGDHGGDHGGDGARPPGSEP